MSSTGRGRQYREHGAYYTDPQLADAVVRCLLKPRGLLRGRVLEPSAGGAAFLRAVRRHAPACELEAMDVNANAPALRLPWSWRFRPAAVDFLRHGVHAGIGGTSSAIYPRSELGRYDLIVGNPPYGIPRQAARDAYPELGIPPDSRADRSKDERPYSIADLHVEHSLALARNVVLLLRGGFRESLSRWDLWTRRPYRRAWTVVPRPSFTGGDTDSASYAIFWWDDTGIREPDGWINWRTGEVLE